MSSNRQYIVHIPLNTEGGYGGTHRFFTVKERDEFLARMVKRGIATATIRMVDKPILRRVK